jgi:transcriptional regulator with XRE-family HTH domain
VERPLIGAALRARRRERGLSLQEVSDATDISVSFLSLVENDKTDLTIGRLMRLASFFGVHVSELIPLGIADPVVLRADERRHFGSPSEGIDLFLMGPESSARMLPLLAKFDADGALAEYTQHSGEEFVFVLEGTVRLHLDGHEPILLGPGDSAYFDGDRQHAYEAVDGGARLLAVVTPPHL